MASARPTGNRALVIGGGGFIGSHIAEHLLATKRVSVLTRRPSEGLAEGLDEVIGDASNLQTLKGALGDSDLVVFAAAGLMPGDAEREPMFNLEQVMRPLIALTDVIAGRPDVHVMYLSSGGTVYGKPLHLPIDENHSLHPISEYGLSKLLAERHLLMMSERHGFRLTILRCANVYGPRQAIHKRQGIVGVFLDLLLHKKPITIYGDGGVIRDYVYVDDVGRVVSSLADGDGDVFNVGTGVGTSIKEVLDLLIDISGLEPTIHHHEARSFDIAESVLSIDRLREAMSFEPTPLRAGLSATWEWYRGQVTIP